MLICLVGMMTTPGFTELAGMFATRMLMAPVRLYVTRVSMLKVEDFTVYVSVFWGFQVGGFYIIGQKCSAEPKDWRVSGEMLCGTVSHREVQVVIGSFPSSRSYNSLYSFHSERGKVGILPFVLVEGDIGLLSVRLRILKEIQEHRAVFCVA